MGVRHRQLRFLDRYRSRGNAYLGYTLFIQTEMENGYCKVCRSNDDLCGYDCGDFPYHTHRKTMACRIFNSIAKSEWCLGKFHVAAIVGRVCSINILHDLI